MHTLKFFCAILVAIGVFSCDSKKEKPAAIGVYYFDGWSGKNRHAGNPNEPWEGPNGLNQKEGWYFPDSSPGMFKSFLTDAIQWMDDNPTKTTKERIVLVYAWNELGEGGYLVPTKGDPEASFLKQIRDVVTGK